MSDQKQQESKATKNEVAVIGAVVENKLKIEPDKVSGSLIVKYGKKSDQQCEVKVYVAEKNGKNEHAKKYDTISQIANTLISATQATEENPQSIVTISGRGDFTPQIRLNEYASNGEVKSGAEVSLGFGNVKITDNVKPEDFRAQFELVIYLDKNPVMKDDRLVVEGYYITYKGEIKPLIFMVDDEDLIDGISGCSKGETIEVWGDVKIASVTETKKKSSGFGGKAKTDEKVTYTRELVITGGNPIDEDDKRAIASEFIKTAKVEREDFLANLIKEGDKPKAKKSGGGFTGDSGTKSKSALF